MLPARCHSSNLNTRHRICRADVQALYLDQLFHGLQHEAHASGQHDVSSSCGLGWRTSTSQLTWQCTFGSAPHVYKQYADVHLATLLLGLRAIDVRPPSLEGVHLLHDLLLLNKHFGFGAIQRLETCMPIQVCACCHFVRQAGQYNTFGLGAYLAQMGLLQAAVAA